MIKKTKKLKLSVIDRIGEQTDGCQLGGGFGDWVKKVTELRSTNL